jgi:hypothetical protein
MARTTRAATPGWLPATDRHRPIQQGGFGGCISSRRERSGRRDIVNASRLRSTEHARKLFLGANSRDFEQLIAKNAGHDVTLENNAQETFHQILDFVHHAVPVQQHADLML